MQMHLKCCVRAPAAVAATTFQCVVVAWDVLGSWYWPFLWSLEMPNFSVAQENIFNVSWALFHVPGCCYYHWRSISLRRCCIVFIIHNSID